jgi:hypothetical protein
MPVTTRQTNLFQTENWTKVYQTFREADFQSYDFESLRRTMIDYLKAYYPEDFNDFIESSEYIALIDLIAFLGQSLAFRADLNSRENFLETAERRDSVLRLARMLNYVPKRSQNAKGLVKITSVQTTESVYDSNENNLANRLILWNDTTNPDYVEQFNVVLNAALNSSQKIGKPALNGIIQGIKTELYQLNIPANTIPVYSFSTAVNGVNTAFEVVCPTFAGESYIYEVSPKPGNTFNILYRNDGAGNGSGNTGFFAYFKQGKLQNVDFNVTESLPNRVVNVNVSNINNDDVWLYEINNDGTVGTEWTKIPAIAGTNVIYNNLVENIKSVFSVNSRTQDQIDLVFGDGSFSKKPQGTYRTYVRTSNNLSYKIVPSDIQNVNLSINYISKKNQLETLRISVSLQSTVSNANERETLASIKANAPQQYYTQNRMINGEDYNIYPLTLYDNILRAKAINRTSSGISRFLDIKDATGATGEYSSTNIYCQDGILYKEEYLKNFSFDFVDSNDILRVVRNQISSIFSSPEISHFYYEKIAQVALPNTVVAETNYWNKTSTSLNETTGYFYTKPTSTTTQPARIGVYDSTSDRSYLTVGALMKFVPPAGYYFDVNNRLLSGAGTKVTDKTYIWAKVLQVVGDGTNNSLGNLDNGLGPVTININVPTGALLTEIYPAFVQTISSTIESSIVSSVTNYQEFGLRYDKTAKLWKVITNLNLDKNGSFSLDHEGSEAGTFADASWLILFTTDGETYTVNYRGINYLFESRIETRFYFDAKTKIYDVKTGQVVKDNVKVLKINSNPDNNSSLDIDYVLAIYNEVIENDGYINNTKVKVTYSDTNADGVPDNLDFFEKIVAPDINSNDKLVFFQKIIDADNVERNILYTDTVITAYTDEATIKEYLNLYADGQVFYATSTGVFYVLSIVGTVRSIATSTDYAAKIGRSDLYFQYRHNAASNRRIDPSPINIIDMYVLTRVYDQGYRAWVSDITGQLTEPTAPSSNELALELSKLETVKSISDTMIFNHVQYKPLFGPKAVENLRAKFKVVKNTFTNTTDSEIKTKVVSAINNYFSVDNFDFGDTFYFSELSAYVHQTLSPYISSIVIVPEGSNQVFGSLYQITSLPNEIFISAATVDDVNIIDSLTASRLKASGTVVNSTV